MSDPKSEPAGTGAQPDTTEGTEPTDAPTTDHDPSAGDTPAAERPPTEDTVAANVDAPAQSPGTAPTGTDAVAGASEEAAASTDAEGPTVADSVAADVDAPAEAVAGGSEETAAASTDVEQPTVADSEQPTVADSVAANVDAPAEAPKVSSGEDTTDAIPAQDGSPDATREMPAQPDKDGAADPPADVATKEETPAPAAAAKKRRNPWPTVGTLVAVLVILAAIGYFGGLGPLNRLSTTRDLNPPDQVAGLDRITDPAIRQQYQLDSTRDALRRINNGKKATVEAYGKVGDRLFMVIALRGKVNIDKEIRDSGASGDQVKKVGKSTCAASVQDIPASCYRGSNTLTVIAQGLGNMNDVNAIGAVADEAFEKMK